MNSFGVHLRFFGNGVRRGIGGDRESRRRRRSGDIGRERQRGRRRCTPPISCIIGMLPSSTGVFSRTAVRTMRAMNVIDVPYARRCRIVKRRWTLPLFERSAWENGSGGSRTRDSAGRHGSEMRRRRRRGGGGARAMMRIRLQPTGMPGGRRKKRRGRGEIRQTRQWWRSREGSR